MVSVSVDSALARGFIEPEALAERGETYEAFTRRLSELITDSMTDHSKGNGSEDLAKTGVRATLSAAKARSPRSQKHEPCQRGATTSPRGDIK
jgi:hypothetical protein